MGTLMQDVRFAGRILWKDRGFSLTSLLTVAVCVGTNAAIFAIVNSVLLRPLPVPEPDRLVLMYNSYPRAGVIRASNGVPDYYDRVRETTAFEEQALYDTRGYTVGLEGNPQRLTAMVATPSLLRLLRVTPLRGRVFTDDETEPGRDRKVLLTYGFWQEQFGARESVVGEQIRVNGVPHDVVGILPRSFHFESSEIRMWVPAAFSVEERSDDARHSNNWSMVGRLKPAATITQARHEIDALNARNLDRFPHLKEILINAGFHTVVTPLHEDMVSGVRATLYLLWGGVLFVLLIGVVNLTNLVLVRSSARMKELATRHALGAGVSRLTGQLLTETLLLTLAGGAIGLALGYWGLSVFGGANIQRLPRGDEIRMDATVVAFTTGLTLIVGVVVGLIPLISMRRVNLSQAIREEGRSGTSGRTVRTFRRILVAGQVGFAFMLLIGAGLLLASFERVLGIDPGFEPTGVLTARVAPPAARYERQAQLSAFAQRLLEGVRAIPGVLHAGITSSIPFGGDYSDSVILAEGYRMSPGESLISPYRITITPGYFEAMDVAPVAGRLFSDADTLDSPRVAIVDERLARRFWPGRDPIGRRMYQPDNPRDLTSPGPNTRWITVVGVVPEVRVAGLIATDDRVGAYYFPFAQSARRTMTLAVKSAAEPGTMTAALRGVLAEIDPELPLYSVRTMEERIGESLIDRRTPMLLAVVFAILALFLAGIGVYGVLAYQVTQRTREIGIRMALGSNASAIFRLVIREGVVLLAAGFAAGFVGAVAIRRTMETQLYGIGPLDPLVLTLVALVLASVAFVACVVPARRAARIDPLVALLER